jgi:hypothetical protein
VAVYTTRLAAFCKLPPHNCFYCREALKCTIDSKCPSHESINNGVKCVYICSTVRSQATS